MEVIFTKQTEYLDKWDEFVTKNGKGNHLIYSDWLASYKNYGFDYEIGLVIENEEIIGGYGAVIAKFLFFKFYIVPHGPIFIEQQEDKFSNLIIELKNRALKLSCCYFQFSFPVSNSQQIEPFVYKKNNFKVPFDLKKGTLFKFIYSSYGINWVAFDNCKSADELLKKFSIQVRRNIKLSCKNNATIGFATTVEQCKLAYNLIEQNAQKGNYTVRSFQDFSSTILSLIKKEKVFFLVAKINNEIKGVSILVDNGNYLSYISGGTSKEKPDLKLGYLLHWEAIKKSFELGYSGYNISMGGSKGVVDFKSKFNTTSIYFDNPHHYFILKPVVFKIYSSLNAILAKNKKLISKLYKFFK